VSGKDLGFVGTDAARLAHVERVLEGSDVRVVLQIGAPDEALRNGLSAPDVALLDASAGDVDHAIAGVALLDAAWPETEVIVLHDDTDPAVIRSVLAVYPGALGAPLRQVRAAPEAGMGVVKAGPGQSIVILGGLVPHRVLPLGPWGQRIISALCFRAAAPDPFAAS